MTEEQAHIVIELLTDIRDELRLQRKMIEKAQRPQAILPAPIVSAVSSQRFIPVPEIGEGIR